jgi:hypothetical protein
VDDAGEIAARAAYALTKLDVEAAPAKVKAGCRPSSSTVEDDLPAPLADQHPRDRAEWRKSFGPADEDELGQAKLDVEAAPHGVNTKYRGDNTPDNSTV